MKKKKEKKEKAVVVSDLCLGEIKFTAATADEAERGFLGWVSCTLNHTLRIDGLAIRRTLGGRLTISYPARRDGTGRQHPIVRPVDDRARLEMESRLFKALGLKEHAAP